MVMMRNPSDIDMEEVFLTKMKGKAPTVRVIRKEIRRELKASSIPPLRETTRDKNINRALTSSALPTFTDMTLMSIPIGALQIWPSTT